MQVGSLTLAAATTSLTRMSSAAPELPARWYRDVTRYDWLILLIASAGWIFDQFESQLFIITRDPLLAELLGSQADQAAAHFWGDVLLGVFLVGGTVGGVLFGSLADRFGRKKMMSATILVYSVFSGLTYFATTLWHVAILRFFVAMGVGGEWAVAAALIAEVFPVRGTGASRRASFMRQAFWGLGWRRSLAWRSERSGAGAYLIGILPALLVLWVRSRSFVNRNVGNRQALAASGWEVLAICSAIASWARRAIPGLCLAAVGLATFWGVTVAGQDLMRELLLRHGTDLETARQRAKFAYGIVETAGGGSGPVQLRPARGTIGTARSLCPLSGRGSHRRAVYLLRAANRMANVAAFCPSSAFSRWGFTRALRFTFRSCFRVGCGRRARPFASTAVDWWRHRCSGFQAN